MAYVTNAHLNYYLTTAIEGGCGYWMNEPDDVKDVCIKLDDDSNVTEIKMVHRVTSKEWKSDLITAAELRKALEAVQTNPKINQYNRDRVKKILNDPDYDFDAEDADVAVQIAFFGDIIFG